ncbi:putative phosphotransferase, aminoglycoside/choline kinase (APH/ChoK) family [Chromobacterium violaceum]|uniref:N-acetylmuramate/N-acetylglucosamine kinase AmgK n=1 Tax=Chromobacterium violaceum TaxID=536 RepID=UPI0005BAC3E2|nr:phosphotransferase [Chromobacterium violaceum]KJH69300.1 aminoglycoside phosphotransferase [Chromobacterium violaceum]MBP4047007.1 phosphotransferase [Chromobacterium violaceum]MCD0492568.1 phosphotransferase [Chromobacterium violaceum]OQS11034.1 aminoglycoside phosphotransferase [Chromobacterium violaceum]OQS30209.1 aminoglycoside phosphotransferase [Chromobacterium violaceum]
MQRQEQLKKWLAEQYPGDEIQLEFAAADADFRRYFRAIWPDGASRIVMDAPPEHIGTDAYVKVRDIFSMVKVPEIYLRDRDQGFIVMEDLGKVTYLAALQHDERPFVHRHLLLEALDTLVDIQKASQPEVLPEYDEALLTRELNLFPEWFCAKELGKPLNFKQRQLWDAGVQALLPALLAQPKVFVHRDFIVRNLMLTPGTPGVLDFQDAVYGPISYDAVSLLRDAFIEWDEEFVLDLAIRYWEKARAAGLPVPEAFDDFYRAFEWMGVQRHLKVAGIFARLYHRDGKDKYLAEIPRFIKYLKRTTRRYAELAPFYQLLVDLVGRDATDEELQSSYPVLGVKGH